MNIKKFLVGLSTGAILLASSAIPAFADSVSVNFESPPYTLGVINGIDGWSSLGAAGSGCAVYDHAVAGSLGTTGFGLQSLRISNAIVSGCFGDQTFSKPLTDSVGETAATAGSFSVGTKQRHFEMQFDIASASPSAQQLGLYASLSPDRGDGSRMSYLRFEDQSDGIHVFFDDVTDSGPVGTVATFNESDIATISRTPHTIKLSLDALDGPSNDVVKVWIDGVLKHTGKSWEDYYRYDPESAAEQSPRIVKSVLFRTGGNTNLPELSGKGFLFDNLSTLSGPILVAPPTNKDQCKNDGWKVFNNPAFANQGQCVSFVEKHQKDDEDERDEDRGHDKKDENGKATGFIYMGNPRQKMNFSAFDGGNSNKDKGEVNYWNFEYPGPLHYEAKVLCAEVDQSTKEVRFMFRIPSGWPGLTGLYVVSYVKDGGTPGIAGDLYGHAASLDLATARNWCETGIGFSPSMYPITGGNLVVHKGD